MVCAVYNKMFLQFSIFPLGMKLVNAFFFFLICRLLADTIHFELLYISNYKHYDTLFESSSKQQKKQRRLKQFCNPCKSSLFLKYVWINSNDHFKLNRIKKNNITAEESIVTERIFHALLKIVPLILFRGF